MQKRVKKAKKRAQRGATFTPRVARNRNIDMSHTPVTPPFAYRPADSITHLIKSKYDMVKQFNADLHNQEVRNMDLEKDISDILHKRDMANKRAEDLNVRKREALQSKLKAEQEEEIARIEFDKFKDNLTTRHSRDLWRARHNAMADRYMAEMTLKTEQLQQQLQTEGLKHDLDKFTWEGMYDTDDDGNEVLKEGAGRLKDLGIDIHVGERELIRQRREYEAKKLVREKERELEALKLENAKIQGRLNMEKDPHFIRLLADKRKAERTLTRLQANHEMDRKSDAVRRDINRTNVQIAKLRAESEEPSAELVQQRRDAARELAVAKEQREIAAKKLRLDREIAEMNAQIGEVGRLDQEITEKRQQVADAQKHLRKLKEYESLDEQLAAATHDYNEKTRNMLDRMDHWARELNPIIPDPQRTELFHSTDPTYRMGILINGVRAAVGQRDEYVNRLEQFFTHVNTMRHDEGFRRAVEGLIGPVREQLNQLAVEDDVAVAHNLLAALAQDPMPSSARFMEPMGLRPEHREPQQL